MDCDIVAHGIVAAAQEVSLNIPLVVRLEGNNVEADKIVAAVKVVRTVPCAAFRSRSPLRVSRNLLSQSQRFR